MKNRRIIWLTIFLILCIVGGGAYYVLFGPSRYRTIWLEIRTTRREQNALLVGINDMKTAAERGREYLKKQARIDDLGREIRSLGQITKSDIAWFDKEIFPEQFKLLEEENRLIDSISDPEVKRTISKFIEITRSQGEK
jgi:hypothetical protein